MKHCPTCQRTYTDDSLRFCLEDGATLLDASDPLASTLLDASTPKTGSSSSDRSAPTEVFHAEPTSNSPASPTRSWGTPNVSQPLPQAWEARKQSGQQQRSAPFSSTPASLGASAPQKQSWPGVTSFLIGILTLLMTFITFTGAGFKVANEFVGFSFIIAILVSVFGVVFGVVAFAIALKHPDRYGGKILALIGLFMSLLPAIFLLLVIAIGIAVTSK